MSTTYAAIGITDVKHVTNAGSCNGSATAFANGNAGPFTFKWSNGKTTALNAGLCPGLYSVTITPAGYYYTDCEWVHTVTIGTCAGLSGFTPIQITDAKLTHVRFDLPISQIQSHNPLTDYGSSIDITTSNSSGQPWGTTKYFKWVNSATGQIVGNEEDLVNVPPGTYCVSITNGCYVDQPTTACYTIKSCLSEPYIGLNILVDELPVCIGPTYGSGGSLTAATPQSDYPITQYHWSGPNGFAAHTKTIIPTAGPGIYRVTVVNACGKSAVDVQEIRCCDDTQNRVARITFSDPCFSTSWWPGYDKAYITVKLFPPLTSCGEHIQVHYNGETSHFQYVNDAWTPSDKWEITFTQDEAPNATVCVTVTNDCGCTQQDCAFIGEVSGSANGITGTSFEQAIFGALPSLPSGFNPNEYFPSDVQVINQCFKCTAPCGMSAGNLGVTPTAGTFCGPNSLETATLTYSDGDLTDLDNEPCRGGSIKCGLNGFEYIIDPALTGIPIIDWNATPQPAPGGRCVLPVGCLFSPGMVSGFGDQLYVFVTNPEGYVIPGSCENPQPPTTECGEGILPLVKIISETDCKVRYYCQNDPTKYWDVYALLDDPCECKYWEEGVTKCKVVDRCMLDGLSFDLVPGLPSICNANIILNQTCESVTYQDCYVARTSTLRQLSESDQVGTQATQTPLLAAYPNPTHGIVHVKVVSGLSKGQETAIQIYDMLGAQVFQTKMTLTDGDIFKLTPFEQLSPGIYTVVFGSNPSVRLVIAKVTE